MFGKKTQNPSDIAAEIYYKQKIKDVISKRKTAKDRASTKFLKRYEQNLRIIFARKEFIKAVFDIRKKLGIPKDGFDIYNKEEEFKKWLTTYKNNFDKVQSILNKYYGIIKTEPECLFRFLIDTVIYDKVDPEIYYRKDSFIEICPTLEIYENYVNEKPFPGIFEFILFDDIFLPNNNLTALFERDNHIILAISPNTTKRDIEELWTDINKWQEKMNSQKNKKRLKKNLNEGLDIIKYDDQTEKNIKKEGLTEPEKRSLSRERVNEYAENKLYKREDVEQGKKLDQKDTKKYLKNRRQIKRRTKELIDLN